LVLHITALEGAMLTLLQQCLLISPGYTGLLCLKQCTCTYNQQKEEVRRSCKLDGPDKLGLLLVGLI